jgi:asparagine synthase (glutamine-hydrolysing)
MDMSVEGKITKEDFETTSKSEGGLSLNSPKELYFYRLFRERFPAGYESLTARWDPHK